MHSASWYSSVVTNQGSLDRFQPLHGTYYYMRGLGPLPAASHAVLDYRTIGALVVVNEWFSGDARFSQPLRQGHVVVARMAGYHSERLDVCLKTGETTQVSVQLKRKTAEAPAQTANAGMS